MKEEKVHTANFFFHFLRTCAFFSVDLGELWDLRVGSNNDVCGYVLWHMITEAEKRLCAFVENSFSWGKNENILRRLLVTCRKQSKFEIWKCFRELAWNLRQIKRQKDFISFLEIVKSFFDVSWQFKYLKSIFDQEQENNISFAGLETVKLILFYLIWFGMQSNIFLKSSWTILF